MKREIIGYAVMAALLGCGKFWDMDKPFNIPSIRPGIVGPAFNVTIDSFSDCINQLGGNIAPNLEQLVTIDLDNKCSCPNCNEFTFAYVLESESTIWFCPLGLSFMDANHAIICHELGHILGVEGHLACGKDVMSPSSACGDDKSTPQVEYNETYTDTDIRFIGSFGRVSGGVF